MCRGVKPLEVVGVYLIQFTGKVMKKNVFSSLAVAAVGLFMMAGSASASSIEYFSLTDISTANSGMEITVDIYGTDTEIASFGIFYDFEDDGFTDTDLIEVFAASSPENSEIYVDWEDGKVTVGKTGDATDFDSTTFGFYFSFIVDGETYYEFSDPDYASEMGYADWYIDSVVSYLADTVWEISLVESDGTTTAISMTVKADDISPVPEPATMFLFGTGLAGLASMGRRKKN